MVVVRGWVLSLSLSVSLSLSLGVSGLSSLERIKELKIRRRGFDEIFTGKHGLSAIIKSRGPSDTDLCESTVLRDERMESREIEMPVNY